MAKRKGSGNNVVESCLQNPELKQVSDHCFGDRWEEHIKPATYFGDDEQVVSEDIIRAVLAENYELRNELYERSNTQTQRVMTLMQETCGSSVSNINRDINNISTLFGIPKQNVYHMLYETLAGVISIDWKQLEKGESKIRMIWRIGLLPVAYITVKLMHAFIIFMRKVDTKAWGDMRKSLQ